MYISRFLVLLQFLSLILLFVPFQIISLEYGWIVSFVCLSLSLKLLLWTSQHNKIGNFNIVPEIKEGCTLIKTGPYYFIRHPMYTSVVLIGIGALTYGFSFYKIGVLSVLILTMYLKASREERFWCEKTSQYQEYKAKTKMFIPFIL